MDNKLLISTLFPWRLWGRSLPFLLYLNITVEKDEGAHALLHLWFNCSLPAIQTLLYFMLGTPLMIELAAERTVSLHCILNLLLPVLSRALTVMRWRRKWMPFIIEIMSTLYLPKKYQRVLPYPVLYLQSFYVFFFLFHFGWYQTFHCTHSCVVGHVYCFWTDFPSMSLCSCPVFFYYLFTFL